MKSLLLTPTYFPMPTGNAVTVSRISRQLDQGGIVCRIMDLSFLAAKSLREQAWQFAPDIIHNFHAWKSGRSGLKLKEMLGIPMITTVTGTDVNADLGDCRRRDTVLNVFAHSDYITVFNEQARALLVQNGVPGEKITVIHQSVFFPRQQKIDYRELLGINGSATIFLLLGSLRRIKNPGYAIELLEKARKGAPDLHLIIAGPILEQKEFRRLEAQIGRKKWITYLGEVPRNRIRSLLRSIDALMNTSSSESESNAVMEAMSCGKIIIGKNICGNASLLSVETALLFDDRQECYRQILQVLNNRGALEEMKRKARKTVGAPPFRFAIEKKGYLDIYRKIAGRKMTGVPANPAMSAG